MNNDLFTDRSIVQRLGAERYLLISLISFAASVSFTRLFLSLTGYPQVGNSELHIAHVVWGGLLLFVSGLLPLVLANAWAYTAGAVLNGAGMGLFIDEIGKFITQSNDYFYPPAAPIIYAFFLLTVLLYVYIRRRSSKTPRRVMYQVLHDLGEVIDHDLQPDERARMNFQLNEVINAAPNTNLSLLSGALIRFLEQETLHVNAALPAWQRRWRESRQNLRLRLRDRPRSRSQFRIALGLIMLVSGLMVMTRLALLTITLIFQGGLDEWVREALLAGQAESLEAIRWVFIRIVLEGGLGFLLAAAGGLLLAMQERSAIRLGTLSLVTQLTTVDLLVFYFDQFAAVVTSMGQFGLLMLVLLYRNWYLIPRYDEPPVVEPSYPSTEFTE